MGKILLVDDDVALGHIMVIALQAKGYQVKYVTALTGVSTIIQEWKPDILVMDVEIGDEDGIHAASHFRLFWPQLPVLFISSHVESSEVIRGMEVGGIAYLKKPFEPDELLAYIRRYTGEISPERKMTFGNFELSVKESALWKDGQICQHLTQFELKILLLLLERVNQVVPREVIVKTLWQKDEHSSSQSLNNYVNRLRKYLTADPAVKLETIYGQGYRISL